jgi:uncharacterized protein (DUF302 family)
MIKKVEIERFSLTSSKPFDQVVAALDAAGLSKAGLMLFMRLDQGAVVQKETGQDTPRIIRFLIGNPLIMKEMAKRVPDAGSYAPVTILVDERPDGVHLSYDRMASFLGPYGNAEASKVAGELDAKVEALLASAASR